MFLQKPDGLTTFGRLNRDYRIKLKNKHLTPAGDYQFAPANGGQWHWLFLLIPQALYDRGLPVCL